MKPNNPEAPSTTPPVTIEVIDETSAPEMLDVRHQQAATEVGRVALVTMPDGSIVPRDLAVADQY